MLRVTKLESLVETLGWGWVVLAVAIVLLVFFKKDR